jgi:hypothetical protein
MSSRSKPISRVRSNSSPSSSSNTNRAASSPHFTADAMNCGTNVLLPVPAAPISNVLDSCSIPPPTRGGLTNDSLSYTENYADGRDHARIKETAEWVGIHSSEEKTQRSERRRSIFALLSQRSNNFGLKVYVRPDRENASLCPSDGERPTAINVEGKFRTCRHCFHDRHVIKRDRFVHGGCDAKTRVGAGVAAVLWLITSASSAWSSTLVFDSLGGTPKQRIWGWHRARHRRHLQNGTFF